MKQLVTLMLALSFGTGLMAQGDDKYGATPEIQEECKKNISIYKDPYFTQGDYAQAVKFWRIPFDICPKSQKSLYINGAKMYKKFAKEAKGDKVRRGELVDTLMLIYDRRIEHFGQEGKVLGMKGGDMFRYRRTVDATNEAIGLMRKSIEMEGDKSSPNVLVSLYQALYFLYGKKATDVGTLLEEYPKLMAVINNNISAGKDGKGNYAKAEETITSIFINVAECPDMLAHFKKVIGENPDDMEQMKFAVQMLSKRKCTDSDEFGSWSSKICESDPSKDCKTALAKWNFSKKNYSAALKYFEESIALMEDCAEKEEAMYLAGQTALKLGQYQTARAYGRKILSCNANNGKGYMLQGQAIAGSAKSCGSDFENKATYCLAVDYYARAKSDSNTASDASSSIATYRKYFPTKEEAFRVSKKEGDTINISCWGEDTKLRLKQ